MLLDYMLSKLRDLIEKLQVYPENMERNLGLTKGLYFSQSILLALTRAGANRQTAYEAVQRAAMRTWQGDTIVRRERKAGTGNHGACFRPSEIDALCSLDVHFRHVDETFSVVGIGIISPFPDGAHGDVIPSAVEDPVLKSDAIFPKMLATRNQLESSVAPCSARVDAAFGFRLTIWAGDPDACRRWATFKLRMPPTLHAPCPPMPKPFYITTAIDYTNGAPHIGHAYEKVLADVIARYHRLKGEKVFFLTGVDQHGQKVQQSAEKAGVAPQQFVDEITAKFIALWEKLEVRYDIWAATTDPLHKKCVQGMLQRLYDEKQIYKDKQEGYYSIRQEQFLTDKERGPDGEFGPEWGEVEHRVEENYYFRLAQHKDWLLGYLRTHPDCVTPDFRQTELINARRKAERRPLHLASEIAAQLGHRAALRSRLRQLTSGSTP